MRGSARRTGSAGACSGAMTRRSTGPRASCPRRSGRRCTRCMASFAGPTRSSTAADGPRRRTGVAAHSTTGRRSSTGGWSAASRAHPVIAAVVDAGIRYELPMSELSVYMDSMRVDCGPVRLGTREDLDRYMRGSAGAVGLLMAPLLGTPAPLHGEMASLGLAFQLTNFIRDVREDYALDRVYLPEEDRVRFGVSERDIAERRATPGLPCPSRARGRTCARAVRGNGAAARCAEPGSAPRDPARAKRVCGRARSCRVARLRRAAPACGAAAVALRASRSADAHRDRRVTVRATARGEDRGSLDGTVVDVLICGASFAGLAVARELAGSRARVLLVDRYEIGERATSACAAPTPWLHAMGVAEAISQELAHMRFTTPYGSSRYRLPWSWSSFDYRRLCELLYEQSGVPFQTAKVQRRGAGAPDGRISVETDRGTINAGLVVDALGWRRVLAADGYQPPQAPLSRGLEVHPHTDARAVQRAGRLGGSLTREERLRVVRACGRRGARGRRVLRACGPCAQPDGGSRGEARGRSREVSGELVPAPAARGHRGRRVLRRRLRGPLLPAVRGGHKDRVLLRHRMWARAEGRPRAGSLQRAGAAALLALQRLPRKGLFDRTGTAAADPGASPAGAHARAARHRISADRRPRVRLVPGSGAPVVRGRARRSRHAPPL